MSNRSCQRTSWSIPILLLFLTLIWVWISSVARAVDPLGATAHFGATPSASSTTFRLWAPFVDAVSMKPENGPSLSMTKEAGHSDPADTVWVVQAPGVKPGDKYNYLIRFQGVTRRFVDPRSQQLTGPDSSPFSVVVDPRFSLSSALPPFATPSFNTLVIYELHIGTFHASSTTHRFDFQGATQKLDYLKTLGVNAIEVMPVHQNPIDTNHVPTNYNWGYDPVQLFAVNPSYGTPQDFKRFVAQCHAHGIAVILDVVYNHLVENNLLNRFGGYYGASIPKGQYFYGGDRMETGYGPRPDYGRPQVRSYIEENSLMWLRDYGVDGLRWDSTINMRAFDDKYHYPIGEGGQVLRESNDAYRSTPPRQPGKISIAEDLQGARLVTTPTGQNGLGFNSQWDESLYYALRHAVVAVNDDERDLSAVASAIKQGFGEDVFGRVIYSENHDKVGHPDPTHPEKEEIRLTRLIDRHDPESIFAKKRSTLAAAIVLTSPGIPMLFQGQEMLENRTFEFAQATPVDWSRVQRHSGIVRLYQDLIALRRNVAHHTGGLTFQSTNVFHVDPQNKTLAYHRYGSGGPGDDVVVVVNFSNQPLHDLNIGFPRGGLWSVRFNSGASTYDPSFSGGDSFDTEANPGSKDNLNYNGKVGIGPYSVIILSQG